MQLQNRAFWGKSTKSGARQGHRSAPTEQQARVGKCESEDEAGNKQRPMCFLGWRRETWDRPLSLGGCICHGPGASKQG